MCGIAMTASLGGVPADPAVLKSMTDALEHRGPDGEGVFCDDAIGLGHRRLAIIDPSPAGAQPMSSPSGRYTITYNGELFNFRELRAELQEAGRAFRTRSDTEVVLAALEVWGTDALVRFNGMFAFALWDSEERRLLLARDRYGIKPLYHADVGDTFVAASEIKAIMRVPGFRPSLDSSALHEYLTFQNLFDDRTLFGGVRLLPAGCWLEIDLNEGGRRLRRYWDFDFGADDGEAEASEEELVEELDRRFRDAVGRHLISDVPVGSYLSGGMDSGSITAVAAGRIPDLRSFTVGFDMSSATGLEVNFDERQAAERLSYEFGTEHYEMVLKAGDMERIMPNLVLHLEDLRVGQSYPNYYAAQLASKFGKVVLSGGGGDELFGGYPWRYYRAVACRDFDHYVDQYFAYWQRMLSDDESRGLLAPLAGSYDEGAPRQAFKDVFEHHSAVLDRPEDYVNHSLYFEAKTFLHGLLLVEDKLSMAHSLETRLPFLDNELVEFAQKLPVRHKLAHLDTVARLNENDTRLKRHLGRTNDGKLLLRKFMRGYVPDDIAHGAKQGFSAPDATWFRGESLEYVRRRLMGRDAAIFDYLDRNEVHRVVDDHLSGRENRRLLIWSLLCLEQWCQTFLGAPAPAPASSASASGAYVG